MLRAGPTPYGYKREGGQLALNPDEAPARLRLFELFAEHGRKKTVAEIINAEGHRTRASVMFTSQTLTRLLTDPRVLGVPGEVEQLVPQELWDRCQAILQSQEGKGGVTRKVTNLFSGVLFCSCGQKMYVPSSSPKYVCSDCRNKIAPDDIEDIFHAQLEAYPLPADLASAEESLFDKWPSLPFESKRTVVEAITKRIEVADKKVICFLYIL
ncbi:recombinase family protein [Kordiimonas sp.]|uniref:recombinase family protein n=1 Tax=Kordiimonas sp. TaxID=1970157 RepID=UPI003A8EE233